MNDHVHLLIEVSSVKQIIQEHRLEETDRRSLRSFTAKCQRYCAQIT